jgi:hypothetical protein
MDKIYIKLLYSIYIINKNWGSKMRKKTIVIFLVSMLVIPSIIVSGEQINNKKDTTNVPQADVPIWGIGDSWTYTINSFWVNYSNGGQKILMTGRIDDLKWVVSDITDTNYVVTVTGTVSANYNVETPVGNIILKLNGIVDPSVNTIRGTIIFNKANLHVVDVEATLLGISSVGFYELPISIPLPIRISADGALSVPFPLFDFPLHVLKFWNLPEIDLNAALNFGGIFGLIKIPMNVNRHYGFTPLAFTCWILANIDVGAGNFDAWYITSLIGGFYEYYYAPSVENIIKFEFNLANGGAQGELKSFELSTPHTNEKSA